MKAIDKRRGSDNKERKHPGRTDTKDRKVKGKNGGRNLKGKEIETISTSDTSNTSKILVSDFKAGEGVPQVCGNMVTESVGNEYRSEESLLDAKPVQINVEHGGNEKFNETSSAVEFADESDAGTDYDSVSSQGDSQTANEDKTDTADDCSHALGSKSDSKTNDQQIKAAKNARRKGAESKKGISKPIAKSLSDNLKNMKVHPKPLSDSSEGADGQSLEIHGGIPIPNDTSNGLHSVSDGRVVESEKYGQEDQAVSDQKIAEMEARNKNLENELLEVAALEIALYSVVPEHGSSAHKVHTPARRLSRVYIYACKHWSQDKRATVARNTVSGLILVSKSCGNDVSRLSFWLSNTIVLREIISQAFGSSCHSSALTKVYESNGAETKSSPLKWKNSGGSGKPNKRGLLQFVDDWQETRTFTSALEKVESWIFLRIVESIWWQTLTPNMQSPLGDFDTSRSTKKLPGPALGDQEQGKFSIDLWKSAFHDALKRLCPVRAGGHECGCLPVLARKVMDQCIGRLDVAMFNAILRESAHEIPTDPVSDPILDANVLPIPAGYLSFGSGAQLKNAVGNWERWLSDFLGMDADTSEKGEQESQEDNYNSDAKEPKVFPLLNTLSDLLMLPKDMLIDTWIRMEICPSISLSLVKRILCNFSPDEFCPDPVPGAVLEALNAECIIECMLSGESNNSFPHTAAPVVYTLPSSSEVAEKVAEAGAGTCASSRFSRSASAVQRKGYTSDEELDELESCMNSIVDIFPTSPSDTGNGNEGEVGCNGSNTRYDLLRQVWKTS